MMYQITNAKEFDGDKKIRWFSDDYMDLVIWLGPSDSIVSFQLVYDRQKNPHALSWKKGKGYLHERVDDGELPGRMKMTPVLMHDGPFKKGAIAGEFSNRSREMDPDVADFVYRRLQEYPA